MIKQEDEECAVVNSSCWGDVLGTVTGCCGKPAPMGQEWGRQTQAQATVSPLFYQMLKMSALKQSYII